MRSDIAVFDLLFECNGTTHPYQATYGGGPVDRKDEAWRQEEEDRWRDPQRRKDISHVVPCGRDATLVGLEFSYRDLSKE